MNLLTFLLDFQKLDPTLEKGQRKSYFLKIESNLMRRWITRHIFKVFYLASNIKIVVELWMFIYVG